MMGGKFWLLGVVMTVVLLFQVNESKANTTEGVVFCYYNSASTSRSGEARFGVKDIPLDLCTHVIYSSIRPTSDGNITFSQQSSVDGTNSSFKDFVGLRASADASKVKLMASLGGSEEDSQNFSIIVNNEILRKKIINVLRSFVQSNNLDGIDLLWKYPTLYGGASTDKVKYTTFIHDLKTSFGGQYLLSAAVGPTESAINASYYVQEINQYVDYINLLSFGFNDGTQNVTGANAPLYAQSNNAGDAANNVNASVNAWIKNGVSPSKLVLGLSAAGKTFQLVSLNNTGVGAAALPPAAELAGVNGEMSYLEICTDQCVNANQWNITEVDDSFVYANKKLLWVGYDDGNTIFAKGEYAKTYGLAGISLWSLDQEDYNGSCGDTYPLLKSAISGYQCGVVDTNIGKVNTTQQPQADNPFAPTAKTAIKIITDDDYEDTLSARKISATDLNTITDLNKNTITINVDDLVKDNSTLILGPGPQISTVNGTIFDEFEPLSDTNKLNDVESKENNPKYRDIKINVEDLLQLNPNKTIILGPGPQKTNLNGEFYEGFEPKTGTIPQNDADKSRVQNTNIDDLDLIKDKKDDLEKETSAGKSHEENYFLLIGTRILRALHFIP